MPGLDLIRLRDWLRENVPAMPNGDLEPLLITGGLSNLTYRIRVGSARWILRRPPVGALLATAHDMGREYRIMAALEDTNVPVPLMVANCEDPDVVGAPFYVMEEVEGVPYRRASQLGRLGRERTRAISESLVDALVALHEIDYRQHGLEDFGRPEGFLQRQVRRWDRQLAASRTRDLPDAHLLAATLAASVPDSGPVGVVHGDYRLDNVLIGPDDQPAGVIDWEMSTLGDTLTDLAVFLVYKRLGDRYASEVVADAASAPGFLTEAEILERYANRRGMDLRNFGFYLGLASFKLAGIFEGIHYRYLQSQTVGPGLERVGSLVEPLLAAGLGAVKERV